MQQALEQLERTPRSLPKLRLNSEVKSLFNFKFDDFEITEYDPYPTIKAPIAV
jgi:thymidylate synthase